MDGGAVRKKGDPNEGPSVRYFCRKSSVYDYALTSDTGKLYLELRIRNAQNCLAYLGECPERIVEMFRHSDAGCQNRHLQIQCKAYVRTGGKMALRVLRRALSDPSCHGRYSALPEINGTERQKVSGIMQK